MVLSIVLLALAAGLRLIPHVSNMTPFFAIAMLVGLLLGRRRAWIAGLMAVVAMLASDLVLGAHWSMPFVYAGLAAGAFVGALSRSAVVSRQSLGGRAGFSFLASGVGSTVFFVISNLGVWLVGGLYPQTFEGLVTCFVMAIPFFGKSLATDLVFGTTFLTIGSYYVTSGAADRFALEARVGKLLRGR